MPSSDSTGVTTLSILDRLIDADPKVQSEVMLTSAQSLRIMKAAVRRDLECLMNTRRTIQDVPEHCRRKCANRCSTTELPDTTAIRRVLRR